jgi:hypothetical protein
MPPCPGYLGMSCHVQYIPCCRYLPPRLRILEFCARGWEEVSMVPSFSHPLPDPGHLDSKCSPPVSSPSLSHKWNMHALSSHTRVRVIIAQKLATTAASTHASGLVWRLGRTLSKGRVKLQPCIGTRGG